MLGIRQGESGKAKKRLSVKLWVADRLSAEAGESVRKLLFEAGKKARLCSVVVGHGGNVTCGN